jgi:hypothetical protein
LRVQERWLTLLDRKTRVTSEQRSEVEGVLYVLGDVV